MTFCILSPTVDNVSLLVKTHTHHTLSGISFAFDTPFSPRVIYNIRKNIRAREGRETIKGEI